MILEASRVWFSSLFLCSLQLAPYILLIVSDICIIYTVVWFIYRSNCIFSYYVTGLARESGTISEDVVRNAFSATEDGFLTVVRRSRQIKPLIAAIGSCCLVGVIWRGTLYVANLGDSRAVLGCLGRSNNIIAEQLTRDHNACMEDVRQELRSLHPDDSHIVVLKHGVWRIKGIIQVRYLLVANFYRSA